MLHPYQDSGGVWTVGIGSTRLADGSPVTADTAPITEAQAVNMMMGELRPTAADVDGVCPAGATTGQRAACYSFAYNLGFGAFRGSTLLRLWRAGDGAGAADQFGLWNHDNGRVVDGLTRRRAAERKVFLGGGV